MIFYIRRKLSDKVSRFLGFDLCEGDKANGVHDSTFFLGIDIIILKYLENTKLGFQFLIYFYFYFFTSITK